MRKPTFVVASDKDVSSLTVLGPERFTDACVLSPGADGLVTLFGGEHMLGGISRYLVTETTNENAEQVAAVQGLTCAHLRSSLKHGNASWTAARPAFAEYVKPVGRIDVK